MTKITEIYKQYDITALLALHQMRVASVADMICGSLSIPVDKQNIIKACILHDMGNIVKFDFNNLTEHNEQEGVERLKSIQRDFILKYGNNDHLANLAIAKELDMPERVCDLINHLDSKLIKEIIETDDFGKKICIYSDSRVSPHGIVSVEHRSLEAVERYKNHSHTFSEEDRVYFVEKMSEIEKQIFSYSNIKPEDINDDSIAVYLEKNKNFEM